MAHSGEGAWPARLLAKHWAVFQSESVSFAHVNTRSYSIKRKLGYRAVVEVAAFRTAFSLIVIKRGYLFIQVHGDAVQLFQKPKKWDANFLIATRS